jgi:serine/threonine protein kinase
MSQTRRALARVPPNRLNQNPSNLKSWNQGVGFRGIQPISRKNNDFYAAKKASRVFVPADRVVAKPQLRLDSSYACLLDTKRIQEVNGIPYLTLSKIGNGGSSKVYKVLSPDRNMYAIKQVSIAGVDDYVVESFVNEIELLKRLQHSDRIIKLIDSAVNTADKTISIVLELGDLDLSRLIEKNKVENQVINTNFLRLIWQQMLEAVQTVHEAMVIHGDLKPANFMFIDGTIKLIDFGIAVSLIPDASTTSVERSHRVGTLNYMAPESLQVQPGKNTDEARVKQGRHADVWSLGCILYQLVYGHPVFPQTELFQKISAICDDYCEIQFPFVEDRADFLNLRDVMMSCLQRNPKKRSTIEDLLDHPYLTLRPKDVEDDLLRFISAIQEDYCDYNFDTPSGERRLERVKEQLVNGDQISLGSRVRFSL